MKADKDNLLQEPDRFASSRHAIVVLGMHRSGTSALTRILSLRGAALPRRLMPPVEFNNETGFWEPQEIVMVHERLLAAIGSSWDDVHSIDDEWFDSDEAKSYQNQLVTILEDDFGQAPLFLLKDPRICRLLPLWVSAFEQMGVRPLFVIIARNPFEVTRSLGARDGFSSHKALMLWLRYVLEAEKGSRGYPRTFVTFDSLLSDWRNVTDRIGNELGIQWPISTEEASEAVATFLTPRRRHHVVSAEDSQQLSELDACAQNVYLWHNEAQWRPNSSWVPLVRVSDEIAWADQKIAPYISSLECMVERARNACQTANVGRLGDAFGKTLFEVAVSELFLRDIETSSQITELRGHLAELARDHQELLVQRQRADDAERALNDTNATLKIRCVDVSRLEQRIEGLVDEVDTLQQTCSAYKAELAHVRASFVTLHSSTSWRCTAPFRAAARSLGTVWNWLRKRNVRGTL